MESFTQTLQSLQVVLLWLNFVTILGLSTYLFSTTKPWKAPEPKRLALLGALFCLSLAIRIAISPRTLLHENSHGFEYLRSAFTLEGFFFHGSAYYAFFYPITAILGRQPETVFWVNTLLSAATPLLFIPIAKLSLNDERTGWFAALLYLFWPPILRIGSSECMFTLAIALGLAALWLWLSALRTGSVVRFVLAACLLSAAVQTRPVMMVWILVIIVFTPLVQEWHKRLLCPETWIALASFAMATSAWAVFRLHTALTDGVPEMMQFRPTRFVVDFFSSSNLMWNPKWTPVSVWILLAVGIAFCLRSERKLLLSAVLGVLLLGWFSLGPSAGVLASQIRLQSPMHPCLMLLAGFGASSCCRHLRAHWQTLFAVLILTAIAGELVARAGVITHRYNPQIEYDFLDANVNSQLEDCVIITAPRYMASHVLATEFPTWKMDRGPVIPADLLEESLEQSCPFSCFVWYRGLSCYLFTWQEVDGGTVPASGFRQECASFEENHALSELANVQFESDPYLEYLISQREQLSIGFHELATDSKADLCSQYH